MYERASRNALQTLGETGLNFEHAWTSRDKATGTTWILLDAQGQNSIAVAPGANFAWDAARVEGLRDAITNANCLLPGNEISPAATKCALELAGECGTPVMLGYA